MSEPTPWAGRGPRPWLIWGGAALVGLIVIWALTNINVLPRLEEQAKAAWAQVENNYQRRADLIPNLVETVKGYAQHEKDVLTAVVEARAKATQISLPAELLEDPAALAAYEQNQAALGQALGRLLAVVEAYPDLKASEQFLALQAQLEGTENRIAVARRDYITAVQAYNTEIRTFPTVLLAWLTGRQPLATFAAQPGSAEAPKVNFAQ